MGMTELLASGQVWRGAAVEAAPAVFSTGFAALDERLGGGWPQAGITELLLANPGLGELELLCPSLARLAAEGRWQLWLAPPAIPYAPALQQRGVALACQLWVTAANSRDRLWVAEQALASGTCSMVLAWLPEVTSGQVRRLLLAAEKGQCCGFILRPADAAGQPSQASLRLVLERNDGALQVTIAKRRGGWPGAPIRLLAEVS